MFVFQTSFGIPAEGVYTGLVILLGLIIVIQFVGITLLARRNIELSEHNRDIAKDAIKGLQNVLPALNAIREQLQITGNTLMGKQSDVEARITKQIQEIKADVLSHLQYLRDKIK